jgi:translation initiation factor 4E
LNLPADTIIIWKSHDDSISQRSLIDQAREKPRRVTLTSEDGISSKEKPGTS